MRLAAHQCYQIGQRSIDLDRHDVGPRHHDVVGGKVAKLQDIAQEDELVAARIVADLLALDQLLDGVAERFRAVAQANRFFDDFFVDGAVDGVGTVTKDAGCFLRKLATGRVQEYLLYVALTVSLFAIFMQTR